MAGQVSLLELARLFFRLGSTAFGGPAAHIAMMRDEVVRRRGWLTEEKFLDLLGATHLIPGPNSTEMAIHIGWERRGWAGLLVAGVCFILPAMVITGAFAWAYVRYETLPEAAWLLYGVKPVVLAVMVQAVWSLTRLAARTWKLKALGMAAVILAFTGINEEGILFACGVMAIFLSGAWNPRQGLVVLAAVTPASVMGTSGVFSLSGLFWVFLKIGSVLFGSGYVLLAFLRADLVERLHWLTEGQLIDAIAVGQLTPGPVFTTATFIGYLLGGTPGAIVATVGIFLPAFVFVVISGPLVPRLRQSKAAGAFLDGVIVASLALMGVVTVQLAHAAVVDLPTVLFGFTSAFLLIQFRVNSAWLVAGGAAGGWAVQYLQITG